MISRKIDHILSNTPGEIGACYCAYKAWRWGDPYVRLVARLADRSRLAVDIGAHEGDYTYFMRRHAARCVAFEANPRLAEQLRRRFGASVDIHAVAISDHEGETELRIPHTKDSANLGRATIEESNQLAGDFSGCGCEQNGLMISSTSRSA